MSYSKCFLSLALLGANGIFAQEGVKRTSFLSGSLAYESGAVNQPWLDRYVVELKVRAAAFDVRRAAVAWDGSFEFRHVPEGMYELSVMDKLGNVVRSEVVVIGGFGGTSGYQVRVPALTAPVGGSPVSLRRLAHKPMKAARKAYDAALKAQKKGDTKQWEAKLREAVALDGDFFEARNNLGALLLRTSRPAEALEQFRAAVAIDPNATAVLTNLSASLLELREPKDAEKAARQVLRIEPDSPQGHYLLGIALVHQNRFTEEAVDHLEASSEAFPKAERAAAIVRDRMRKQAGE